MIGTTTTYQASKGDIEKGACHGCPCRASSEGSTKSRTTTNVVVPDEFICPITHEIMKYPLFSRYGHVYERDAILEWLTNHRWTCPITRCEMYPSDLVRHYALEYRLEVWHRSQQRCFSTKPPSLLPHVLSPESSNNNLNNHHDDDDQDNVANGGGAVTNDDNSSNNIASTPRDLLLPSTTGNRPSERVESHCYERKKGVMNSFLLRMKRRCCMMTPVAA